MAQSDYRFSLFSSPGHPILEPGCAQGTTGIPESSALAHRPQGQQLGVSIHPYRGLAWEGPQGWGDGGSLQPAGEEAKPLSFLYLPGHSLVLPL